MNKIKKFLNDNKLEIEVTAYGVVMLALGLKVGANYKKDKYENMLNNIARSGKKVRNIVDGKIYELAIKEV